MDKGMTNEIGHQCIRCGFVHKHHVDICVICRWHKISDVLIASLPPDTNKAAIQKYIREGDAWRAIDDWNAKVRGNKP